MFCRNIRATEPGNGKIDAGYVSVHMSHFLIRSLLMARAWCLCCKDRVGCRGSDIDRHCRPSEGVAR